MTDEEPMLTLQVRLPREMIERLDQLRFGMPARLTRAQTIRWCLDHALTILQSQKEEKL